MAPVRVLLVDDTARFRSVVRELFDLDGRISVVGEAADGREALSVAERERPDVVLLDVDMPVMDGLQALPHLRDRSPSSRVVMLSSHDARDMAPRALAAGAAAYIEKGSSVSDLMAAVLGAAAASATDPIGAGRGA